MVGGNTLWLALCKHSATELNGQSLRISYETGATMDAGTAAPNGWGFSMEQTWHAHVFALEDLNALGPCNAQIIEIRH